LMLGRARGTSMHDSGESHDFTKSHNFVKSHMEKLHLDIKGMHCGSCATGIQMVTSEIDGVGKVFVDYDGKNGDFEFDPSKTSKEKILEAIETLGYTAS